MRVICLFCTSKIYFMVKSTLKRKSKRLMVSLTFNLEETVHEVAVLMTTFCHCVSTN